MAPARRGPATLVAVLLTAATAAAGGAVASTSNMPRKLLEEAAAGPASAPSSVNLATVAGRPPSQDAPSDVGGVAAAGSGGGGFVPTPAPAQAAAGGAGAPRATAPGDPCPLEGCPIETFSFVDVVIARGKAGVRKAVPDHMTPLLPTAPWSTVSGPGGVGPNLYWETATAATSVPGLAPGFEPDHEVSQVLEAAKAIMVATENAAPDRVPLPSSRMVVAPVDDVAVSIDAETPAPGPSAAAAAVTGGGGGGDARVKAEGEGVGPLGGPPAPAPPPPPPPSPASSPPASRPPPPPPATVPFGEYGIQYWGGEMMLAPPTLHYVFIGAGWLPSTRAILADFGAGLGGSAWLGVQTTYTNRAGTPLPAALTFGSSIDVAGPADGCWPGKTALTDVDLAKVVACALADGRLPYSPDAIYATFTPRGMSQGSDATGSFCQNYCGWHSTARDGRGRPFKFVFADASPNGNVEADGMASILAHEVTEAASDPALDAWYDGSGNENADKCAWAYGNVYRPPPPPPPPPGADGAAAPPGGGGGAAALTGGVANTKVGSRHFLIQLNWANRATEGHCDLR